MKFVVYEVWTRSRVIDADDEDDAYRKGEPRPNAGFKPQLGVDELSLCNWHVVPRGGWSDDKCAPSTGGLNYRQVDDAEAR